MTTSRTTGMASTMGASPGAELGGRYDAARRHVPARCWRARKGVESDVGGTGPGQAAACPARRAAWDAGAARAALAPGLRGDRGGGGGGGVGGGRGVWHDAWG